MEGGGQGREAGQLRRQGGGEGRERGAQAGPHVFLGQREVQFQLDFQGIFATTQMTLCSSMEIFHMESLFYLV